MNTSKIFSNSNPSLKAAADHVSAVTSSAIETSREKLQEARQIAQKKLEAAGESAGEAMQAARQRIDSVGGKFLRWTRQNPAAALAAFFASGVVVGCALALQRHEKTFDERLREDPVAGLRDALSAVLSPLRERASDTAHSVQSSLGKLVDRAADSTNGHSWGSRLKSFWN